MLDVDTLFEGQADTLPPAGCTTPAAAPKAPTSPPSVGASVHFATPQSLRDLPTGHPLDEWLASQDMGQWRYVASGHLVGPDAKPEDDFDLSPDWNEFVVMLRTDLKRRCRFPKR